MLTDINARVEIVRLSRTKEGKLRAVLESSDQKITVIVYTDHYEYNKEEAGAPATSIGQPYNLSVQYS